MVAAVLLFCLLTLRCCQDKYCLLKVCTESTSCTKLRVMKISSGLDKLTLLLLTQAMGESFLIHILEMLLLSKSLQLFHYRRHSFSSLLLLIWLVPTSGWCDACTSTHVCLVFAEKLCCRLHKWPNSSPCPHFHCFLNKFKNLRKIKKSWWNQHGKMWHSISDAYMSLEKFYIYFTSILKLHSSWLFLSQVRFSLTSSSC